MKGNRSRRARAPWRTAALGALALATAWGCGAHPGQAPPLTILAAASLGAPFRELADTLRARDPGLEVRLSLAGSHQLALQVEQGARVDVVAVADPAWLERLARQGFVAGTTFAFATNTLVLAVPAANPGRVAALADLARPGVKLVLGMPQVPVGRYAREVLERLGHAPGYPPGFTSGAHANVVSEEQDVGSIAAKLRLGEADAAFLYRSDLAPDLRVIGIPDSLNARAEDAAAVIRGAPNPGAARAFLALLASPAGQATLRRHGFGEAPGSQP
jgi:molybdate transport system substrate-binding protein